MRVAICSQSGAKVDQSVGRAQKYYIYDVDEGCVEFIGLRLKAEDRDTALTGMMVPSVGNICKALSDCQTIYSTFTERLIAEQLIAHNIEIRLSNRNLREVFNDLTK